MLENENKSKSNAQSIPIIDLIYVPDDPRNRCRPRRRRGPTLAFRNAIPRPPQPSTELEESGATAEPQEEKLTLEHAFSSMVKLDGTSEDDMGNCERAVRAVAFLLDYVSSNANKPVDGYAATGLARCLDCVADDLAFYRKCSARHGAKSAAGDDHAA